MNGHDVRFDDAPAVYLLGALTDEEANEFVAHARDCEHCRAELRELRPAADALPSAVEQHEAPPALEDRIMAVVRSEAELLHASGPAADVPAPARPTSRRGRGRLAGWFGRPAFALAATLVVLALGALGGVVLSGGGGEPRTRTLQASAAPDGATVSMLVREGADHATLEASGLPRAGEDRVYQVWLVRGQEAPRRTNALFRPSSAGAATVDVPSSLRDVDEVLVSSEPDGGSDAPTRDPVIAVPTS